MSKKRTDTVLIVNPTVAPAYLNEKFKEAGFFILACFTSKDIDYLIQPSLENRLFDEILFLTKSFEKDIEVILDVVETKQLNLCFAFSSSEYDLHYSDKIVHYFCPKYSNSPETSSWRCNKRAMNERLRLAGLRAAKQKVIADISDIKSSDIIGLEYPIVVKPSEGGGGSIGVSICSSLEEIQDYFRTINEQKWAHCYVPKEFLLEELLIGNEFIVDMVAWGSNFYLIGIYYAQKEVFGPYKICRHREFLRHDDPIAIALFEYCSNVLKSLDVQYGMMHVECMYTENGPVLIELNPRVSGVSGVLNYFAEALIGCDQGTSLIGLLNSSKDMLTQPCTAKHGVVFYLQNFGFNYHRINEELFKSVPSYLRHLVKIPSQLEKTYPKNLLDTVAFVILVGDSEQEVMRDLNHLKTLEASGVFFEQI